MQHLVQCSSRVCTDQLNTYSYLVGPNGVWTDVGLFDMQLDFKKCPKNRFFAIICIFCTFQPNSNWCYVVAEFCTGQLKTFLLGWTRRRKHVCVQTPYDSAKYEYVFNWSVQTRLLHCTKCCTNFEFLQGQINSIFQKYTSVQTF